MSKPAIESIVVRESKSKAAVIFIHGFTGSGQGTWNDLAPRLMLDPKMSGWDGWVISYKSTFKPDLLRNLWSADASIDKLALQVATDINEGSLSQYDSIVLIAHSMGGLVTQRAILNSETLASKAHAVIFYGTPSGGLEKASYLKFWKRQIADMEKDGDFISSLRRDWSEKFGVKPPFNFLAIAGQNDEFVPDVSSIKPFAANPKHIASVPGHHTSMVHPPLSDSSAIDVARNCILGDLEQLGNFDSVKLAIESGEFRQVVRDLEPNADSLDKRALVNLAIALDSLGERSKAEQYLAQYAGENSDALGTLGGRLKRQWMMSGRSQNDAEAAEHYYRKGYEIAQGKKDYDQIYYLGINLAFLSLVFRDDKTKAQDYAKEVLNACEKSIEDGGVNDWVKATQAEAHFILGQFDQAYALYDEYVNSNPKIWKVSSTYLNAMGIASSFDRQEVMDKIEEIFVKAA